MRYRVIRHKSFQSLLIVITCIIGCGGVSVSESRIKDEAVTESAVSKESGSMTAGMDESEKNERNSSEFRSENDSGRKYFESKSDKYDETGSASFISDEYDGAMTASGSRYDRNGMTAAHPSLPFDTKIVVTNLRNKRSVELVVIDRFDPSNERILNVSHRAAVELDLMESGVVNVGIRIASDPEPDDNDNLAQPHIKPR